MFKKIFSSLIIASMLLSFAACNSDEGGFFNAIPEDAFTTEAAGDSAAAQDGELSDEEVAEILESFDIDPNDPEAIEELMIEEGAEEVEFEFGEELIDDSESSKIEIELDEEGRPDRSDTTTEFVEVFDQDKFTLKMNIKMITEGEEMAIPVTMIKSGEELYMELTVPVQEKGGKMRMATLSSKDGNCYMIMPAMRMYMAIPADSMGEMLPTDFSDLISEQTSSAVYVETREVVVDGKTYTCDVYEQDGVTGKHYYDENGIKRIEYTDGESVSIMEITELSNTADASKFRIPSGYINMEKLMGSDYSSLS